MEGTFVLDPHPAGIFISQDACHTRLPPAGISVIFQLCWVPPGKNISIKNAFAQYFYAKACHCFHNKERKNLSIYVNAVSNNHE